MKIVELMKFACKNSGVLGALVKAISLIASGPGEDLRAWLRSWTDVLEKVASFTETDVDDKVTVELRKVINDDEMYSAFESLINSFKDAHSVECDVVSNKVIVDGIPAEVEAKSPESIISAANFYLLIQSILKRIKTECAFEKLEIYNIAEEDKDQK